MSLPSGKLTYIKVKKRLLDHPAAPEAQEYMLSQEFHFKEKYKKKFTHALNKELNSKKYLNFYSNWISLKINNSKEQCCSIHHLL